MSDYQPQPEQYPNHFNPPSANWANYPPTTYGYKNGLATAALVTGIVGASLFFLPWIAIILGILALVFGIVALYKIKRGTSDAKGRAVTGVVLGPVAIILGFMMWAAYYQAADDLNNYSNCLDRADTIREMNRCSA